jgi:outer membrane protein assembly factor BamA
VRAFGQDRLTTEAGNAVLILNQELRFPLFWRIGGVGFFDAGNIYRNASSLKAWDLRYSPGVGLRFNTPFLLLRFDMGLNLWARAGEPPRRFVFGIGQAF